MSTIEHADIGQIRNGDKRRLVYRHVAQWCAVIICAAERNAAKTNPMGGAEQHHPFDGIRLTLQRGKSLRRRAAGIDVAGVRNDQCFGMRRGRMWCCLQQGFNNLLQFNGFFRIEQTGNSGFANVGHGTGPLDLLDTIDIGAAQEFSIKQRVLPGRHPVKLCK